MSTPPSIINRRHVPTLCCAHRWTTAVPAQKHVTEYCRRCGATCVRGAKGELVEYDRTAEFAEVLS